MEECVFELLGFERVKVEGEKQEERECETLVVVITVGYGV